MKRDIKPIYAAPSPDAALAALAEFEEKGGEISSEDPAVA